jgi:hypothetical protein
MPNPTPIERDVEKVREQREKLLTRHSHALTSLMETRTDLRGVHALADFVDDAVRWSA